MIQTDRPILDLSVNTDRELFFTDLYYSVFPLVANFVRKQGGDLDGAKDIFHDSLIILYEKKSAGAHHVSDEAYLIGIAKHLWIKRYNAREGVTLTASEEQFAIPEDFEPNANVNAVLAVLKAAGTKCMALLQDFYYHSKPLEKIKTSFGFSSIRSATVQKFKCLQKVREVVKMNSKRYEDFFE
jgi:hypothetical protein